MPDVWATFGELDAITEQRLAAIPETRGADPRQQAMRQAFLAGRWAWRLVADQLGAVSGPVVPPVPALAVAAGALLAANLAAAGPGWVAARIRPATVLRTE